MSKKKTYEELVGELETLEAECHVVVSKFNSFSDSLSEATLADETDNGFLRPLVATKIVGLTANVNEEIIAYNKLVKRINIKERLLQKRK